MRTWALSAGLSLVAGCASVAVDPHAVPVDEISENQRDKVKHVLADVAAVVPLEGTDVKSRPELLDFLLSEMPFTGGVVRELNRGKWDIHRNPEKPEKDVFYVKDTDGMWLRFELVHRDGLRRFYLSRGFFPMGLLPRLEGRTLVVMRSLPKAEGVWIDAVVYVRVETEIYRNVAKATRGLLEEKVREKSGYFIGAAKWVAELAAQRPDWLYEQVKGSKEVDQEVLEEFRRKYLR